MYLFSGLARPVAFLVASGWRKRYEPERFELRPEQSLRPRLQSMFNPLKYHGIEPDAANHDFKYIF